jgi:DNA-binding transcriptional LysR family regulator
MSRRWAGLEVRHLLALQAVAERGSFHKAAAELDYTQSGISQQINALERIVGERLVDRPGGSRPVRLTACGELLLGHARALLGQVTAAQADVDALRAGAGGCLRVGAFQSVSATILAPLLSRLARDQAALRIDLTQTTSDPELLELLEAGDLDVTFVMLPVPEGPFAVLELFSDPFVVMVAHDGALAHGAGEISVRDLASVPVIVARTCRSTAELEAQMRERGLQLDIAHRSDDNGTVLGLVATGAAVALVPRMIARAANGAVAVREIAEHLPPRRVALAWHSERQLPDARAAFVDQVVQTCRELRLTGRDSEV